MANDFTYILGVHNCANYESGAAILKVPVQGGNIEYVSIGEDRLTRDKQTYTFPLRGIDYCMKEMGLDSLDQIDFIATEYSREPRWLNSGPAYRKIEHDYLKAQLDYDPSRIRIVDHHDAHAVGAFYPSGYDEAAILVIDGMGSELNTQTLYHAKDGQVNLIERGVGWGIGKLYSLVTANVLPYGPEKGYGKVMGLAPYGAEVPEPVLDFKARDQGMTTDYSEFYSRQPVSRMVAQNVPSCTDRTKVLDPTFARASYDIQCECERQFVRMAELAYEKTGCKNLCLSGGVALNGRANHLILEHTPIERIWIPPCCSDTGMPIGVALHVAMDLYGMDNLFFEMKHAYTGRDYPLDEVKQDLKAWGVTCRESSPKEVAGYIYDNKIIGWFDGPSETGPRALGHRSILADASKQEMKDKLNQTVKFREQYRPYAPSVLKEQSREWFDLLDESPYMLLVCEVKEDKRDKVPSITHIDGTARVQDVDREYSPLYWEVINEFYALSKVPMLLNTSFNVNREPIVETPLDAMICSFASSIDYLVFGGELLVDCEPFRDPELVRKMIAKRTEKDDEHYRAITKKFLKSYNEEGMKAYLARENEKANWYIKYAAEYELEKFISQASRNKTRLLIAGTDGHTQALYEYGPGFNQLSVSEVVAYPEAAGETGTWPSAYTPMAPKQIDWSEVDEVFISTHEYQDEVVRWIQEFVPEGISIRTLYDTAMDSLYYTLERDNLKVKVVTETSQARNTVQVVQIDEVSNDDQVSLDERYAFVCNHHFVHPPDKGFMGMAGITPDELDGQLRQLADNFQFVTARELVDPKLSLPESVALVTFDDACRDVFDYAVPVLRRFGIRGTIFVSTLPYAERRITSTQKRQLLLGKWGLDTFSTNFYEIFDREPVKRLSLEESGLENVYRYDEESVRKFKTDLNYLIPHETVSRILDTLFHSVFGSDEDMLGKIYMTEDELKRVQDEGWEIGGHSHGHSVLSLLSERGQENDLHRNRAYLSDVFSSEIASVAYPFGGEGSYTDETIRAARSVGYRVGFTMGREVVRPSHLKNPMCIPRFDNQDLFGRDNQLRQHLLEVLSTGD